MHPFVMVLIRNGTRAFNLSNWASSTENVSCCAQSGDSTWLLDPGVQQTMKSSSVSYIYIRIYIAILLYYPVLPVSTQIPESAASPLQTLASQPEASRSWRNSRCVGEICGNHGPLHIQKCPNNSPMAATPMASSLQLERSLLVSIPIWKLCPSAVRRDFAI